MVTARAGSTRARRAAEMRRTLAAFEGSGLSQVAFCRREAIPLSTFTYWRRRLGTEVSAGSPFVELRVVDRREEGVVQIALPGGAIASIGAEASEDFIRRILRAAGASC